MKRFPNDQQKDRGAALAMVLTMLAIMSVLAIVVVDVANMSIRRTSNQVRMEQTRWYLLGAEAFAAARLDEMRRRAETVRIDQDEWQARSFFFPLDDGTMEVSLRDGGNCFNLNSVVTSDDGGRRSVSPAGMVQFARLLDAADVSTGQGGLGAALIDWIDSDSTPTPGGGEDEAVSGGEGYRTSNALLADMSELARVRGFDEEIIAKLAPYVCVRPTSAANLLNPNTLRPQQAALLSMAVNDLSLARAAEIIRSRPRGGWETVDDFLRHPGLSGIELNEAGRAQFSLQTRYYVLTSRVERLDATERSAALLEQGGTGRAVVVRRVFGAGAGENPL